MMAQYNRVKTAHPDCLLFFRMGDFFELFGEDAVQAAAALDIALTKRQDIQMCGVPVHAYENYLAKLIKAGFKVAICDQLETPQEAKQRGGHKALVTRDVVRIVTPGTLTEDPLLDTRRSNYLAAISFAKNGGAIAWADISTGDFHVQDGSPETLGAALARIDPSECLICEKDAAHFPAWKSLFSIEPKTRFDAHNAKRRLQERFQVASLEGFGSFSEAACAAAGTVLEYIERTQKNSAPLLGPPRQFSAASHMILDAQALRNLEIFTSVNGEKRNSLLSCLDHTKTPMGGRLLATRLAAPSCDVAEIEARLDEIEAFTDLSLRKTLRPLLAEAPDVERALGRLSFGRGGPRDLAAMRAIGQVAAKLRLLLNAKDLADGARDLQNALNAALTLSPFIDGLERALVPEPPMLLREGGFIASGYNPELDEQRRLRDDTRRVMAALQARYVQATGLSSLKISYNAIIGYHIEVSARQAETLLEPAARQDPQRSIFIHRQTMASNVRFTTEELLDLEQKISRAGDRSLALELDLFEQLRQQALNQAESFKELSHAIARLDVASSMAELAAIRKYARPAIANESAFEITGGRHPVVEEALQRGGQRFTPNECVLENDARLWLITGPNMAGKSTFLRQNAIIAIMAQAGLFVPAANAAIGIIDRVFSRVGAGDDLSSGRSTFMVEMTETAIILNQATRRSLVIVDEIGRGTATQDGLALARACLEYFHDSLQCRGLFATHFHELTALEVQLDHLVCYNLTVKEHSGDIHFLHKVEKGAADRSFGVHVAKLAGLPPPVVKRAADLLRIAEKSAKAEGALPLFGTSSTLEEPPVPGFGPLDGIDPDALTPKEALELLYRIKHERS